MIFLNLIITIVISYLLGSISVGYFVGKIFFNDDLRKRGSGNLGTTNVQRVYGNKYALLTLFLDMSKGIIPVLLFSSIYSKELGMLAGVFSVIGHNHPFYLHFKGGKGIATSAGAILAINPKLLLVLLIVFLIVVIITKYVSLASILGAISAPIVDYIFKMYHTKFEIYIIVILCLMVVFRHITNIERLLNGNENKLSFKRRKK